MALNLLGLSISALVQRKTEVIEENHKQINDLEHDYFQQMNQLYIAKQTLIRQYQQSLINQLNAIDMAIQQKTTSNSNTNTNTTNTISLFLPNNIPPSLNNPQSPTIQQTPSNATNAIHPSLQNNNSPNSITTYSTMSPPINMPQISNFIISNIPHFDSGINTNNSNNNATYIPTQIKTETIKNEQKDIKVKRRILESMDCHLCHQSFDNIKHLNQHLKNAHMFKCDLCAKPFQKSIDLKRHQRIHSGVKVYECKKCYKTYTTQASLHDHMRLHDVSTLFRCEYCGKGFTVNHHLKRHLRIHTGVTPFNCRYCDKPFQYKWSAERHERNVHKDIYVKPQKVKKQT